METIPSLPAGCPCPDGVDFGTAFEVYRLIGLGTPRLALSVACGVPLFPMTSVVKGAFSSTTQTQVAEAFTSTKVDQDFLIEEIDYTITNTSATPAGIDSINNFFFLLTSGIEAKIEVSGPGGGYNPVFVSTPLWLIKQKMRERPWLFTIDNQILITFTATVTPLPFTVTCAVVFKGKSSQKRDAYWKTPQSAATELRRMGYCVADHACWL